MKIQPRRFMIVASLIVGCTSIHGLNVPGVECADKYCSTTEYCNKYNNRCQSCASVCDPDSSNYLPKECAIHCQEYLRDTRYVLVEQYEDLRGEVGKLWILVTVAITVAFLSLLTVACLLVNSFAKWRGFRGGFRRTFPGTWIKKTAVNKNNNNNHENNNKASDDAEVGTNRHNGLGLTMPTISASVAPSRVPRNGKENGSGNRSGRGDKDNGNGNGNGNGNENGTPNTTSTSLSGRHPSEDTTLDYAYDNPAMTPSPESVQIRANRESSF